MGPVGFRIVQALDLVYGIVSPLVVALAAIPKVFPIKVISFVWDFIYVWLCFPLFWESVEHMSKTVHGQLLWSTWAIELTISIGVGAASLEIITGNNTLIYW